jgi:heat-inducible transcriptional repressor
MPELTERQRRILARLIAEYIEQGEPVSSAWLAEHSALKISSATIRNILARLEERGLVRQPHTSAGRVPTDSGYRFYVDVLIGSRRRARPGRDVALRLGRAGTMTDRLEHASHELSRASHQIGFAMTAASGVACLRHIDFAGLEGNRVLVILVATGGQVTHRVIETIEHYDMHELSAAAAYINAEFAGLTLHDARAAILEAMRQERMIYDALMARALRLAEAGLQDVVPEDAVHIQGASFLVDELLSDQGDRDRTIDTLRTLLKMLEEKHRLIELLTHYLESSGLTVVIGSEHQRPDLQPFSVVASSFDDGETKGTVGIIGPTRMRYERAISAVDAVSQVLTRGRGVDPGTAD